jgi:hypothetical protein
MDARRLQLWRHWDARLPHNGFIDRQLQAAKKAGSGAAANDNNDVE